MQIGVESSRAVENKRVFVVDGDEITRAALQFMLHDENETHELNSLEKAWAKGEEWRPDLILLGLAIVGERGLGVLADLALRFPGVKLLIVAPSDQDPLAKSCLEAGAHAVLGKPLTIASVRYKVDVLLGRRKLPLIPLAVLT
jgi:CheY-like chemotaxis protein